MSARVCSAELGERAGGEAVDIETTKDMDRSSQFTQTSDSISAKNGKETLNRESGQQQGTHTLTVAVTCDKHRGRREREMLVMFTIT